MSTIKALYVQHPDSALPGITTSVSGNVTLGGNVTVSNAGIITTPDGEISAGGGGGAGYQDIFLLMGA